MPKFKLIPFNLSYSPTSEADSQSADLDQANLLSQLFNLELNQDNQVNGLAF